MILVEHRVNSLAKLRTVPENRGVEIDVREQEGRLLLCHDPGGGGEPLEPFLDAYSHALLVVNVKCDGVEDEVLELLRRRGIGHFFFLDVAPPRLIAMARRGIRQLAVRYSEYEPIEQPLALAGLVDWVWVDCFTRLALTRETHARLHSHFRICLVSPELQQHPRLDIQSHRAALGSLPFEAVCTDFCGDWEMQ